LDLEFGFEFGIWILDFGFWIWIWIWIWILEQKIAAEIAGVCHIDPKPSSNSDLPVQWEVELHDPPLIPVD
jgi:hypothetical protein